MCQNRRLILVLLFTCAAHVSWANVPTIEQWTGTGSFDVVMEGVGTGGGTTANLSNFAIGGSVVQAYLYWSGHNNVATNITSGNGLLFDGVSLRDTGRIIADHHLDLTPVWHGNYNTFIADVTDLVSPGTNTYSLSGIDFNQPSFGAGLQVVYEDATLPTVDVSLFQGSDWAHDRWSGTIYNDIVPITHTFAAANFGRTLEASFFAPGARNPNRPETLHWKTDLDPGFILLDGNPLVASDGPEWDTPSYQLFIPAGATSATFLFDSQRPGQNGATGTSSPAESFGVVSVGFSMTAIPEPSTALLVLIGAGVLFFLRRHRRH